MPTIPSAFQPWNGANVARWSVGRMLWSNGAAAGVHTVAFQIPAYSILFNVGVIGVALWDNNTSAGLIAGDADDPDGYLTSVNLKATDLLAGQSLWCGFGTSMSGSEIGAYVAASQWTVGAGTAPQYNPASRVITFTNTTVGATPATTGETLCLINYLTMSGSEPITVGSYVAT